MTELRRASGLSDALAANDRVKYYFSLLQMALGHADHPDQPASNLKRERRGARVDDASLDTMVESARRQGDAYQLRGAGPVMRAIADEMRIMSAPVSAAGKTEYDARLRPLLDALPAAPNDCLTAADVVSITQAGKQKGKDSLHRLVMDLHKELNALQAALAEETLDGASVYALRDADRPKVKAFMAGVNRTAGLKFAHPGLDTTATRAASGWLSRTISEQRTRMSS